MSIVAAEFLNRFTGDVPWAHIDIAGTAWDVNRPYSRKGGSGFGVRLWSSWPGGRQRLARAPAGAAAAGRARGRR